MTYDELLAEIFRLDPQEQARLVAAISEHLTRSASEPGRRSILELCGLGKEIWQGIDAQEYVRQERAAWERRE
jgi:hypothetical protein